VRLLNCIWAASLRIGICLYRQGNELLPNGLARQAMDLEGGETSMTVRTGHDADFETGHLTLYGAAAIVLLFYAWTFVY